MGAAYAVAYLAAAELDLGTTSLALTHAGASEGNVYAAGAGGYAAARAWAINLAGGAVIEAALIWSLLGAERMAQAWLSRPIASFAKFYVNPFARSVADRAPLHMLSFCLAFPPLRLLAAGNNLMIWRTGMAPLGWLIGVLSQRTTPLVAFWLVMGPAFYLLTFAAAPLAAQLLQGLRRVPGTPTGAPQAV